jgi:hypothetical protein
MTQNTLRGTAAIGILLLSLWGLLHEFEKYKALETIDPAYVASLLNRRPGDGTTSEPVRFKAQCDYRFFTSVCDILVEGAEAIVPLSVDFSSAMQIEKVAWGANGLRLFPFQELVREIRLASQATNDISVKRILIWDPQFISFEFQPDPAADKYFHADFVMRGFHWKIQSLTALN